MSDCFIVRSGGDSGSHPEYPVYDGDYEITPQVLEQVLETEGHVMIDDVTVLEIPLTEVSNPYGGKTAIIG